MNMFVLVLMDILFILNLKAWCADSSLTDSSSVLIIIIGIKNN